VTFTEAFLKALKPSRGRKVTECRDHEVSGLEIRVWAGGAKSWRCHYTRRSDGRRRVVGLGSYPAIPLKDARRKARRLQSEVEDLEGRADPAAKRAMRKAAVTFSDLANSWIELHAEPNISRRALRDDLSMLSRHITPEIGSIKACEITKRDVLRLLADVASKPDARVRKCAEPRKMTHRPNRVFELVRAIFRWGVSQDELQVDPTYGLKPPIKKEKPRERALAAGEIRTLWAALDRAPDTRRMTKGGAASDSIAAPSNIPLTKATALELKLSLVTAQRIGEVTGMAVSELSLSETAPVWVIPGSRTKNGEPNRIPLSTLALELIGEARALGDTGEWIFPSPSGGGPIDAHAPTRALGRARSSIGIENFRVHDLRRTAATRMAEMGVSPYTISLVLNHVSARRGTVTTKAYVQYSYDREKREALDAWAQRLTEIISGLDGAKVVPISRRASSQ
jgi:integrase